MKLYQPPAWGRSFNFNMIYIHSSIHTSTVSLTLPSLSSSVWCSPSQLSQLIQKYALKSTQRPYFNTSEIHPAQSNVWTLLVVNYERREWRGGGGGRGREGKWRGEEGRLEAAWDIPLSHGNWSKEQTCSQTAKQPSVSLCIVLPFSLITLWGHSTASGNTYCISLLVNLWKTGIISLLNTHILCIHRSRSC